MYMKAATGHTRKLQNELYSWPTKGNGLCTMGQVKCHILDFVAYPTLRKTMILKWRITARTH